MEKFESYESWLKERIFEDENILENLKQIASKYNYEVEKYIFGIDLKKKKVMYENDYARVNLSGLDVTISTVSSHWSISESVIFSKELNESVQLASEINVLFENFKQRCKKVYDHEKRKAGKL